MSERRVTIATEGGLHAHAAAVIARIAAEQAAVLSIARPGGTPVPLANLVDITELGLAFGDEVVIHAEGEDAEESADTLAAILSSDLDS